MLVQGIPPEWVGQRVGIEDFGPCATMGIVEDGIIKVGLVWCDYKPLAGCISMCLAIDDPRPITKGIMAQVFAYAFDELKVRRITNACSVNNPKALAANLRAGFKREGLIRRGYPDGSDMIILGLLPEERRYV